MNDPTSRLLALVDQQGLVRVRDVNRDGIATVYLTRLVRAGVMERVARGLYARASTPVSEHVSLAEVAALAHHGLRTQNLRRVWLALPHKSKPPTTATVGLEVVRMHPQALAAGVGTHDVGGTPVRIFDPSKTIADLVKFRSKVGLDVALEALRAYWASDERDPAALHRYARIDGIDKVVQPYLEAVAA